MCDGHKLAVDAGVGADGRRSTMTSTRPFPFQFPLSRRFSLTLDSLLSRSFSLKRLPAAAAFPPPSTKR